mgnify:FL=1
MNLKSFIRSILAKTKFIILRYSQKKKKMEKVRWGNLRRLEPFDRDFGFNRGNPVDRYYIEKFLEMNRSVIDGKVLEVGGVDYIRKFGCSQVTPFALQINEACNDYDIIGDLATGHGLDDECFDCVLLTQTLPVIYDIRGAIRNSFRILKPGGAILASVFGIAQISRFDMDRWGDYWRFTDKSIRMLFEEIFDPELINVRSYGNVLTATSFLHGISCEELSVKELNYEDRDYPVSICIRATKSFK